MYGQLEVVSYFVTFSKSADLRRSSRGGKWLKIRSHRIGVDFNVSPVILIVEFNCTSTLSVCVLSQTEAPYSPL